MNKDKLDKPIEFECIETPEFSYIKEINGSYRSSADNYIVNGEKPTETNKNNWFKVKGRISKVEKNMPDEKVNFRYELKQGYPESELCPKIINETWLEDTQWEEVSGLYERKYDTIKGGLEEIEFKLIKIADRKVSFKFQDSCVEIDGAKHSVSHGLLDEIETYPDLLFEKPCKLTKSQMFTIVKKHLESNIDTHYARIDGNYSWRIKVDKRLRKANPYTTQYNANSHDKRRKARWVTTHHTDTFVNIIHFEDSSSTKIYPPELTGKDIFDLQEKLNEYLDGLVKLANEPYKECECCGGYGVLKDDGSLVK